MDGIIDAIDNVCLLESTTESQGHGNQLNEIFKRNVIV